MSESISLPSNLIVYFDGSCSPRNPGGTAVGAYRILDNSGKCLFEWRVEVCRGITATNNVAEWAALHFALKWLKKMEWKGDLRIRGDSQLVIKQLNGQWRCHKETLREYRDKCLDILKEMTWQANWIPREQNTEADALSKDVTKK